MILAKIGKSKALIYLLKEFGVKTGPAICSFVNSGREYNNVLKGGANGR
jgi:hypothetical protein